MSKFLTYWSLAFAVFFIWIVSIAVALADVKDELLDKIHKQWVARGKARLRPANPLAGLSVAETLPSSARTEVQEWVYGEVSRIANSLGLSVKIVVLQDSMDHFLVHFAQGRRLVTYRVDKAWVADARSGKTDQLERIRRAVEQYLRVEFLGEKPAPPPAAAPAAPAAPAATPVGTGAPAAAAPGVAPAAATSPTAPAPAPGAEMSREERIAAAKAKAEAIKAQRDGAKSPDGGAAGTGGAPAGS
ncbi:MAG: hypothetical protein ACYDAB_14640 [bacterium]